MMSKGCFPYRPNDYVYDPIFTVSGPTDHYKAAIIAKMSSVKFQICPIFPNMFSDLPNHPRVQLVQRRQRPIQTYEEKLNKCKTIDPALQKPIDVRGADRAKFFCPVVKLPQGAFVGVGNVMPRFTIERVQKNYEEGGGQTRQSTSEGKLGTKDIQVQTVYRDSDAQTLPWQPPCTVIGEGEPEILKLEFLKWGSGLPAGMHEVRLIERARMKRAWENNVRPDINDENSLQKFRDYVEALERDEWAFREKEIQEIQDLRLHLLEKMLDEVHKASHTRAVTKLDRIIQVKEEEKKIKLEKIRKKTARELRKLDLEEKGVWRKYHEPDIIAEHTSFRSELYAPLIRNGEHPKRWHHIIDEKMQKYKAQFIGVEQFSTLPRWLDQATALKRIEKKGKKDDPQLCIRETKWTAPVLKELHDELLNMRKVSERKPCSLRVRNEKPVVETFTPEVEGIASEQEEQYQAMVYLQSIIKGRAVQMLIYEGRENCKELIQELKCSIGLLKKQKEMRSKEKLKVRAQQREETIQSVMVSRLQGTLGKLQGQVVGSILDFLNKELRRLLEERKAHAMCWVNERERNIREAAEAGRRQKEIRRRKEHDEIFRQIVKVTQESVDLYLNDVITEGMDFASKEEAKNYVLRMAEKVEKEIGEIDKAYCMKGVDEQNEMIADLVHHFVLPEVEKQMVRQKIVAKQKAKLKNVHEAIYSKLENMPRDEYKILAKDWPMNRTNSDFSSAPTIEQYSQWDYSYYSQTGSGDEGKDKTTLQFNASSVTPVSSRERPGISLLDELQSVEQSDVPLPVQDGTRPDILELYLNMLSAQDDLHREGLDQEPFLITERIPEINNIRNYRPFTNDLDTIPETENETTSSGITTSESFKESDNLDFIDE